MAEQVAASPLREKLALGTVYSAFFVLVFAIALYQTFPYDRLRDYVMARASSSETGHARSVQIGELHPVGLSGVELRDVEIVQSGRTADDPPSVLRFSRASLQISPFALLFGDKKLTVHAAAGGGKLDAKYVQGGGERHVEAELASLDLGKMGVGSLIGLPLKGKASGHIDLNVTSDIDKSTGTIKLQIRGLKIGDGKAKIKLPALGTGLTLDQLDAGKLVLNVDVHDGLAMLTRFATDGRDLKLGGKGSVRLVDPIARSRLDATLDLNISDEYKNKSDRTKAMFEIISMRPEWKRATTPEGTMRVHLSGTFQAIRGGPAR